MKRMIFKMRGNEFRTPALNVWQKLNVAFSSLTGISTRTARRIERVNEHLWEKHCEDMQNDLNEERVKGWGFCYLTGNRIDF